MCMILRFSYGKNNLKLSLKKEKGSQCCSMVMISDVIPWHINKMVLNDID